MLTNTKMAWDSSELPLGAKLRARRRELNLTMQHVADHAGLSVGFISQIERGSSAPSLSSLSSISRILEMPMAYFLEETPHSVSGPVTRKNFREPFQTGSDSFKYERISADLKTGNIRAVIVHEPPGHRAELSSHEGEELFYVLNGSLIVELEDESIVMHEGDSIHFLSTRQHASWNYTSEVCTFIHVCTLDIFDKQD